MTVWGIFLGLPVSQVGSYGSDQVLVQRIYCCWLSAIDDELAVFLLDNSNPGIVSVVFSRLCFFAFYHAPENPSLLSSLSSLVKSTETLVEAAGASFVYLLPYSFDLNPIEKLFAKVKQLVRGLRPRNWRETVEAAKQALLQITFDDIQNAFLRCGYTAT